jgi:hypothetical protein
MMHLINAAISFQFCSFPIIKLNSILVSNSDLKNAVLFLFLIKLDSVVLLLIYNLLLVIICFHLFLLFITKLINLVTTAILFLFKSTNNYFTFNCFKVKMLYKLIKFSN